MISIRSFVGTELAPYINELARLRIRVFREFPYLYDGDLAYEEKYLNTYTQSPTSFTAICFDENEVVGATTALPLIHADLAFQAPLIEKKYPIEKMIYYGESVLLAKYRGQGIGKRFMEAREKFARSIPSMEKIVFCAVVREQNHPSKPQDYQNLEPFWRSWGFLPLPNFVTSYKWKDLGDKDESEHKMQYWLKELNPQ